MKPRRNDLCPCGSGRKYKHCCQVHEARGELRANVGQMMQSAITQRDAGKSSLAGDICRMILEIEPEHPDALNLLGMIAYQTGHSPQAVDFIRQAISANKRAPDYYKNLVTVLIGLGRLGEAEACLREMLIVIPSADAHNNLGSILQKQGRMAEAIECYRRAVKLKSDNPTTWNNLGYALQSKGEFDEAVSCYRRAVSMSANCGDALLNLGNVLIIKGEHTKGIDLYRQLIRNEPARAETYNNLANALVSTGQLDDAMALYRRSLDIKPDFADAHSNLIYCMDMAPAVGLPEQHRERRKWDEVHAAPLWGNSTHINDRSPSRRLRVGYVSADFREHSASMTFVGILTKYDRSQFDVFAYSSFAGKGDKITELFKQGVTVWRDIGHLPDDVVAQIIREDRIDILVDLSGHSAGNRLLVFARKPAPIQVTGWGYGSSTGMRAMDVFFTDPVLVPSEDRQYFSEEVRYQSSMWSSYSIGPFPDVNQLPALSCAAITFGSFNRLAKMSDDVYRAWGEVLTEVPQSRLIMKTSEFGDAATREKVAGYFAKAGVAPDRIIMQGKTPWIEHVQAYNQVDIGLDPFPHGGGATTLESVIMGVPVITLRWPTIAGRLSASIMTTVLGLPDWITETPDKYVKLAVQRAKDLQALAALRQQLRGIVTSAIGDQAAHVRTVEQEYRQLWERYCAQTSTERA